LSDWIDEGLECEERLQRRLREEGEQCEGMGKVMKQQLKHAIFERYNVNLRSARDVKWYERNLTREVLMYGVQDVATHATFGESLGQIRPGRGPCPRGNPRAWYERKADTLPGRVTRG